MPDNFLKEHAVYQIYPISFKDGNRDGKGDLKGIIEKLDYLLDIGIKIIWLSPIYRSPMFDMGYDISDYYQINPIFGTMDDFDRLMEETKKRGMRVIMDLVVNHTSDEHPWFQEALKNKDSKYRDYYIFKEGKKGKKGESLPPNNWESNFTGSAWEKVGGEENTYYLHLFHKKQPDLNWHNPEVLKEVENIISFWMDKGVYGFRCDVISEIYKESYEDGKKSKLGTPIGSEHYVATEGNHRILKQIRKDVIEPRNGVLIGECGGGITPEDGVKYLEDELDTFFQFETAYVYPNYLAKHANIKKFKNAIIKWQTQVDYNGNYLENHDQHRSIGKYVWGKNQDIGAKMLLTLLFTLRGTPFIYMGEEVGARDYSKKLDLNLCSDCVTSAVYNLATKKYHLPSFLAKRITWQVSRDDSRAPMAFSKEEGYGFADKDIKPWQVYNGNGAIYNYDNEKDDPDSILSYFKKVNQLREENKTFVYGNIGFLDTRKEILNYIRKDKNKAYMVILNLTGKKVSYPLGFTDVEKKLILSNYEGTEKKMRPYEASVYELKRKLGKN